MSKIKPEEIRVTRNLIAAGFLLAEAFRRHAEIADIDADARREGEETAKEVEEAARKLARDLSERIDAERAAARLPNRILDHLHIDAADAARDRAVDERLDRLADGDE